MRNCINNQYMHFEGQSLKPQLYQYCICKSRAHYFYRSPIKRFNILFLSSPILPYTPSFITSISLYISFPNPSLPAPHQRTSYLGKNSYLPSNTSHSLISKFTLSTTTLTLPFQAFPLCPVKHLF